ncbi:restriction endonuclease subunit S [Pseudoprevotella muciniphila]|uniref:Restriction endonuclease subunit S n=1 Tax=Pseudoprevotella muciniphila TaxID=2133944 RepID=A0A5P8E766_9BACT|nr:restriction endonuclease subunit S [Pseudoprevotella muciniphila]QFQ12782.1 restriction endonuclease subunit S [Pseudoprevotella muciniphila]
MKLKEYTIGQLAEVTRGTSLSGEFYSSEGKFIRLTGGNFDYQNNRFKHNTSKENLYYIGEVKDKYILKHNDIITPLTEQTPGLIGSTAFIPESGKYIQSQDVALVTPNESLLDKDFCFYLLSSNFVKKQLASGAQQTKIRHTSPDRIKQCKVFIPAIEEQKRIGKLLRHLDEKITLNIAINRNLATPDRSSRAVGVRRAA